MGGYKPDGYTTVSPYLVVPDAAATIEFLVRALGAVEIRRFAEPGGRIVHAELRVDDTVSGQEIQARVSGSGNGRSGQRGQDGRPEGLDGTPVPGTAA